MWPSEINAGNIKLQMSKLQRTAMSSIGGEGRWAQTNAARFLLVWDRARMCQCNVCHALGEGNQSADFLAKLGARGDSGLVVIDAPPLEMGNSCVKLVILNRPQKLNSLNHEMICQIKKNLELYEKDPSVQLVILKGNGKAFCAGGDVVSVITSAVAGHWTYAASFYKKQLTLDHLIATYEKPTVSLINGVVMGGGAGLSMHTRFRVVTEKAVFAMPEASIGLFPDVGANYFLSRLPGYFGEYLGLTGARLDGTEIAA
ncbi:3-hydroxyisobutyryl-CoA hydrolase 3 [Spatholobus suberectus]|nr:3-hydroxyisobutyryl-CoA hydrolase 3 [Spatholobus suberectus]